VKPLTGPCYDCQMRGSVYYPEHDNYMCAKHAAQVSLWEESREHLLDLITPTVEAWRTHWLERGLTERDIESTFESLEPYLLKIVQPEN
jgi:hypothetical protein